ncbi:MAG: hypothetical protein GTO41_28790, partial [Burkholderiales bacterium]|nr:hypothetical protein [Burkholderiales bacterium]
MRIAIWILVVLIIIGICLVFAFGVLKLSFWEIEAERLEPVLNEFLLVGAGLFFLIT